MNIFFENFSHLQKKIVINLVQSCVILVRNGIFLLKKYILKNGNIIYTVMDIVYMYLWKKLKFFWPIWVMQLDNGVTPVLKSHPNMLTKTPKLIFHTENYNEPLQIMIKKTSVGNWKLVWPTLLRGNGEVMSSNKVWGTN